MDNNAEIKPTSLTENPQKVSSFADSAPINQNAAGTPSVTESTVTTPDIKYTESKTVNSLSGNIPTTREALKDASLEDIPAWKSKHPGLINSIRDALRKITNRGGDKL